MYAGMKMSWKNLLMKISWMKKSFIGGEKAYIKSFYGGEMKMVWKKLIFIFYRALVNVLARWSYITSTRRSPSQRLFQQFNWGSVHYLWFRGGAVKSWGGVWRLFLGDNQSLGSNWGGGGEGHDCFSFSNILNPLIKIFIIEHENFEL
jgi:hypothetical protein